jgi:hypothetical protein
MGSMTEFEGDPFLTDAANLSPQAFRAKYSMTDAIADGVVAGDCSAVVDPMGRKDLNMRVYVLNVEQTTNA